MKKLLLGVCLFLGSVPLWAQQAETESNGFQFIAPLRLSAGTDSNFLVDRTDPSIQTAAQQTTPKALTDQVMTLTLPKNAPERTVQYVTARAAGVLREYDRYAPRIDVAVRRAS